MKHTFGAVAIAAALAFAGASHRRPRLRRLRTAKATVEQATAASDTEISSHRRHWRRYRYVRPCRMCTRTRYGYYRPRPYYYRPYAYGRYYRPAYSIGPTTPRGRSSASASASARLVAQLVKRAQLRPV